MLDAEAVALTLSGTLGLPFAVTRPFSTSVEAQLADGQDPARTFSILVTLNGRHLQVRFRPGRWAGDLVREMGLADEEALRMWTDLIGRCSAGEGSRVTMAVNSGPVDPSRTDGWPGDWQLLDIGFERARVAIDEYDRDAMGLDPPEVWVARFGAAVAALLPLEEREAEQFEPDVEGDPLMVTHLRYERSRRNRAAAIAIHGYDCRGCDANMERIYGPLGVGFIHVHHEVSLAEQGGARAVDPYTGLVPLCPNCHSIVHRRRPPHSIATVRAAFEQQLNRRDGGRRPESSQAT